jgi:hypothetical protein
MYKSRGGQWLSGIRFDDASHASAAAAAIADFLGASVSRPFGD